ncbi:MAG: HAD family phosphatase [Treponema sp.]|nr:HAD family phosphatase [Treponema sp.]
MNEITTIRPAAAIFDMDGLMLDTERLMIPLWQKAAAPLGWTIPLETSRRLIGLNGASMRALFATEFGEDFPYNEIVKEVIRMGDEQLETGIAHKQGLVTLLDHLSALGIPLAVATSTRRERALWKLQLAGILDRFEVIICGDEITNGKPAPDIFLLAAERLGKVPSECVGFEDSPAGLQGLHAAGIRSVFVKDTVEPSPEILATVWRICTDLGEAAALFG